MRCPVCGSGNPHEARFCTSCGVPLGPQGEPGSPDDGARELAARDVEGLIRETFRIYRSGFQSFLLIALIPQAPLAPLAFVTDPGVSPAVILAMIISFVLSALANGAMVCAVSQNYLGKPVGVSYCFGRAWARVLSLVLSTAAFVLAIVGAVVTVIGIPLAVYLAVVWFFFTECIIMERKGPLASLWHSRDLVRGSFWRILGVGGAFLVIAILGFMAAFAASWIFDAASPILGALAYTAAVAALVPIMWIGEALVYFDLRVRKHGYTIEKLAVEMGEA